MAAITVAVQREKRGIGRVFALPIAAEKIVKGAIVAINAAGFASNAVAGAGPLGVAGIAAETVDNSGGVAGVLNIRVDADAEWLFACSSITQASVGLAMLVVDNNTIDETSASSNTVGKLTQFVSTTSGWAYVPGLTN